MFRVRLVGTCSRAKRLPWISPVFVTSNSPFRVILPTCCSLNISKRVSLPTRCYCALADAAVAAVTTLVVLDAQYKPLTGVGLKLPARTFSPGVYTILCYTILVAAPAAAVRWQLTVRANSAIKMDNVPMPGKFPAEGTVQSTSLSFLLRSTASSFLTV